MQNERRAKGELLTMSNSPDIEGNTVSKFVAAEGMGNCVHLHGGDFERTADGCLPVEEGAEFSNGLYRRYEKSQGGGV